MLAVISPAKKLHEGASSGTLATSKPRLLADTGELLEIMRGYDEQGLGSLMSISPKLAALNHERYERFEMDHGGPESSAAVLTFAGDTYVGLDAPSLTDEELVYANDHVAILSGLYGVLRAMDVMQPYRLEMGTTLGSERGRNLYEFWGSRITDVINDMTEGHGDRTVINLASAEYSKAVRKDELKGGMVTPVFREMRGGVAKTIGLVSKRSRGMMARYIVENRIEAPEALKDFTEGGYAYQAELSTDDQWVFLR